MFETWLKKNGLFESDVPGFRKFLEIQEFPFEDSEDEMLDAAFLEYCDKIENHSRLEESTLI